MVSWKEDQAAGLRRLFCRRRQVPAVAFLAPTAGRHQPLLVARCASELAGRGQSVLVLDELAAAQGVATALGACSRFDLAQAVQGDVALDKTVVRPAEGIRVVTLSRLCAGLDQGSTAVRKRALAMLEKLQADADWVLIQAASAASGGAGGLSRLAMAADCQVLAIPSVSVALTDAYRLIKRFALETEQRRFRVAFTEGREARQVPALFANLRDVAETYLDVRLEAFFEPGATGTHVESAYAPGAIHGAHAAAVTSLFTSPFAQTPDGLVRRLTAMLAGLPQGGAAWSSTSPVPA